MKMAEAQRKAAAFTQDQKPRKKKPTLGALEVTVAFIECCSSSLSWSVGACFWMQKFHEKTLKYKNSRADGWESIKKFHPGLLKLVRPSFIQLNI
jgi:hypothetical protein